MNRNGQTKLSVARNAAKTGLRAFRDAAQIRRDRPKQNGIEAESEKELEAGSRKGMRGTRSAVRKIRYRVKVSKSMKKYRKQVREEKEAAAKGEIRTGGRIAGQPEAAARTAATGKGKSGKNVIRKSGTGKRYGRTSFFKGKARGPMRGKRIVQAHKAAQKSAKAAARAVKRTARMARRAAKTAAKAAALASNPIGWIIILVFLVILIIVVAVLVSTFMAVGSTAFMLQEQAAMGYGGAFVFPLHNHETHNCEFTDTFGADRDGGKRGHSGIDIGAVEGDPIYSPVNGVVVTNRWNGTANPGGTGGGWEISVKDDRGYVYKMLHMRDRSTLAVGTEVVAGITILGYVGHTGANITADHLHISMQDENGNYFSGYEILRRTHDNPWNDPSGNIPADGNKPAILNSVVTKPIGVSEPVATLTGYRITYYSGGEGETVDAFGNPLVIGTAAKWMELSDEPYPAGMPSGTVFSIGEGTEERFYKITDVGSFGDQPADVKAKTLDLYAGDNVSAEALTSAAYGVQTDVTIKIWKWGNE